MSNIKVKAQYLKDFSFEVPEAKYLKKERLMVKKSSKVIITCAVTGSIHTPSMSAHLPVTPGEISEAAIAAAEAGAAILHLHARDPETGKPSQDPSGV